MIGYSFSHVNPINQTECPELLNVVRLPLKYTTLSPLAIFPITGSGIKTHIFLGRGVPGLVQTPTSLENMLIFVSSLFSPQSPLPLCHVKHTQALLHVYQ